MMPYGINVWGETEHCLHSLNVNTVTTLNTIKWSSRLQYYIVNKQPTQSVERGKYCNVENRKICIDYDWVFPSCLPTRHQAETLPFLIKQESRNEKTKDRLHSTSHSSTPPYIPKQRRPFSESQWTLLSWVTHADPITIDLIVLVMQLKIKSYPLLFLNQGGGCEVAFCWIN